MRKSMKLLAVLLALLMVLAVFASCRRDTPETEESSETEPTVTEPAETEPAETEPAETEPAETEPAETEPAETEPAETEPAETEPAETEPAETEPAETEPAETEPAETELAETEPAETEPAETKPTTRPTVSGGSSHRHSYTETVVEATCVAEGYTLKTCRCGKQIKSDVTAIDADAHKWNVLSPELRATCLENGVFDAVCEYCSTAVTEAEEATGHVWTTEVGCEADGVCGVCSVTVPATGHAFGEIPATIVEATCRVGVATYACLNCDHTVEQELPPISAHTVSDDAWTRVGDEAVADVLCTYERVETAVCSVCEETLERRSTYSKHTETVSVVAATCVADGEKVYTCSDCGQGLRNEPIPMNANAHKWDEGVVGVDSNTVYSCTLCGHTKTTFVSDSTSVTLSMSSVDEVAMGNGASIMPDADTKAGLGDMAVTVSVAVLSADDISGLDAQKKAQIGDGAVYDLSMTDGTNAITEFDGSMKVLLPYALAEGEDPDAVVVWYIDDDGKVTDVDADYIDGYVVFETTHFSYYTPATMSPEQYCEARGHAYVSTVVSATCGTGGYTIDICSHCGDTVTHSQTEALSHEWDITVTEATCTEKGTELYECKNCDEVYEKALLALGHSYEMEADNGDPERYKDASCSEAGIRYFVCEHCQDSYSEKLPQLRHEYSESVTAPTCTEKGYTFFSCDNCDYEFKSNYKKETGHSYGEDGLCASCGEACEHTFKKGKCTVCGMKEPEPEPETPEEPEKPDAPQFPGDDEKVAEKTFLLTEKHQEYEDGLYIDQTGVTVYYDEEGNAVKAEYFERNEERTYTLDDEGAITRILYVFSNNVHSFDLEKGSAERKAFNVCTDTVGYQIAGESTSYHTYSDKAERYDGMTDAFVTEWESVGEPQERDGELGCVIFFVNTQTGEVTLTPHGIEYEGAFFDKQGYSWIYDLTQYLDDAGGEFYCAACGKVALKHEYSDAMSEDGSKFEYRQSISLLVDGEFVEIAKQYDQSIWVSVAESTKRYSCPINYGWEAYGLDGELYNYSRTTVTYDEGSYCLGNAVSITTIGTDTERYENHRREAEYELLEGAVSCDQGVKIKGVCILCGNSEEELITYHDTFIEEEFCVYENGCWGEIVLTVCKCPCGLYSYGWLNSWHSDFFEEIEIDGVLYEKETCSDCGLEILHREYNETEACVTRSGEEYIVNGVTYDLLINIEIDHPQMDWRDLPSEEGRTVNEDGTVTVTDVEEYYCKACGEIEDRWVWEYQYDSTESYKISEVVTILIPNGDTFRVHQKIVYNYTVANGKYLTDVPYSYRSNGRSEVYAIDGSVTDWWDITYQYVDEDYCGDYKSVIVFADGSTSEDEEEGYHVRMVTEYVLRDPEHGCPGGIDEVTYCVNCGVLETEDKTHSDGHFYDDKETLDVVHECNGLPCHAILYSDVCGMNDDFIIVAGNYEGEGTSEEIDGITYDVSTLTCSDCGEYSYTETAWTETDEQGKETSYVKYDFGNGITYTLTFVAQ